MSVFSMVAVVILAATPDAGDVLSTLLQRHVQKLELGGETLVPGPVYFANPSEPRFVTSSFALVAADSSDATRLPRRTDFGGAHAAAVVDRKHLRVMTPAAAIDADVQMLRRSRDAAFIKAKIALERFGTIKQFNASLQEFSGRNDQWQFDATYEGSQPQLLATVEIASSIVTVWDGVAVEPSVERWLDEAQSALSAVQRFDAHGVFIRDPREPSVAWASETFSASLARQGADVTPWHRLPKVTSTNGDVWCRTTKQVTAMVGAATAKGEFVASLKASIDSYLSLR